MLKEVEIEKINLESIIELSSKELISLAIWKYPADSILQGIVSFSRPTFQKISVQDDQGFVLGPYRSSNGEAFLIEKDVHFSVDTNGTLHSEGELNALLDLITSTKNNTSQNNTDPNKSSPVEKELFTDGVRKAVEQIENKYFKKVVLSRRKKIKLTKDFSISSTLQNLINLYPKAFITYTSTSDTGQWIGASPEILLKIDEKKQFHTVALAGTQAALSDNVKDAVWTQKEIEEQALVSRYIIDCFKKIRLREYEDEGPRTVKAGKLFHLCTDFMVNMQETNALDLGDQMLPLLHPTSAVCGMPKQSAEEFILENEYFDRKLFAGYLGPLNIDNQTHFAVNLRCAQISNAEITLYAGVGITQESDPEKEWVETNLKFGTMENAINAK